MRYAITCGVMMLSMSLCIECNGQVVSQNVVGTDRIENNLQDTSVDGNLARDFLETRIDSLEICQCLSQEERDILKRYPAICEALVVVQKRPRYTPNHNGPFRCGSLNDVTQALLGIGDKEAAKVTLRLTLKAFADMPFLNSSHQFFYQLQSDFNRTVPGFSSDEIFSQEFLDDLIAQRGNDISDNYNNGLFILARTMATSMDIHNDSQLKMRLNFIAQVKTSDIARKELFFILFNDFPGETASALVDGLSDPSTKKVFSGYLAEIQEWQKRQSVRNTFIFLKPGEPPKRSDIQQLIETAKDPFQLSEAILILALDELEEGNIAEAVKQAREAEKIYAAHAEESMKIQGPAYRIGAVKGIETFYSKLAIMLIQDGEYEQGIDFLVEGAREFSQELYYGWNSFLAPPILELHAAVQDDAVRAVVRKKLNALLQSSKDYATRPQSHQLRAVLEMQIALGFEEDAIPVLKTTTFVENEKNSYRVPIWDGMTVIKFQLRCGLFEEAMLTYSKTAIRDTPNTSATSTTERTSFLSELARIAIARNEYDHAESIIELTQQKDKKSAMMIFLAQAYQKSGNSEKALETVSTLELPATRSNGYLSLFRDLMADKAKREQNAKQIEILRDILCEELAKIDDSMTRYEHYFALVTLLYQDGQYDEAMAILDDLDSPHTVAWMLLNIVTDLEQKNPYPRVIENYRDGFAPQIYPDYYTEDQLVKEIYGSPDHYLNPASTIKSAREILSLNAEKNKAMAEQREVPFEPDKAAMRMLLDKAVTLIGQEEQPNHHAKANLNGAIGKMEIVYFTNENAKIRFDEALDSLKSEKFEPNSSQTAYQLALLYTELGEKEKATEAIQIALFGYDPDEPTAKVVISQAVFERLLKDVPNASLRLEILAKNGGSELAARLFLQICEQIASRPSDRDAFDALPWQLPSLQIIALYHDNQNPENLMLPKAKEYYHDFIGKVIRDVNNKNEGFEKQSSLHHILFVWMNGEKRIQTVQDEIEKQAKADGNSFEMREKHIQSRRLGYHNFLYEFGNPFYRDTRFQR